MSISFPALVDGIIQRLEAGVAPWRKPWSDQAAPGVPLRSNAEPFTGSNLWLLAMVGAERGYASPYWFTFKQALEIGAPVRKGAKAAPAILYKTRVVEEQADTPSASGTSERMLRYMRTYAVFNAEDLTDCPAQYLAGPPANPIMREAARSAVLDAIPSRIVFGGGSPCFIPSKDLIRLPAPEAFATPESFLATKAHEQLHWSGAAHRLNREFGKRFGDSTYAFEELVAELGACALGLQIGLPPQIIDDHAAYLDHWVRILRDRPGALLEASGHASRAVEYLMGFHAAATMQTEQRACA